MFNFVAAALSNHRVLGEFLSMAEPSARAQPGTPAFAMSQNRQRATESAVGAASTPRPAARSAPWGLPDLVACVSTAGLYWPPQAFPAEMSVTLSQCHPTRNPTAFSNPASCCETLGCTELWKIALPVDEKTRSGSCSSFPLPICVQMLNTACFSSMWLRWLVLLCKRPLLCLQTIPQNRTLRAVLGRVLELSQCSGHASSGLHSHPAELTARFSGCGSERHARPSLPLHRPPLHTAPGSPGLCSPRSTGTIKNNVARPAWLRG